MKASMTEGKGPVCVVGKAKLKVDRNKYGSSWISGKSPEVPLVGRR